MFLWKFLSFSECVCECVCVQYDIHQQCSSLRTIMISEMILLSIIEYRHLNYLYILQLTDLLLFHLVMYTWWNAHILSLCSYSQYDHSLYAFLWIIVSFFFLYIQLYSYQGRVFFLFWKHKNKRN